MSKIAVASSSYEQKVYEQALPKNLRRRLRLERVVEGRLVIPRRVRMARVVLLYGYVVGVKVYFCRIHTTNTNIHNAQIGILFGAFQHGFSLLFCGCVTLP